MSPIRNLLFAASAMLLCSQAMAQVTFYEGENFRGRAFTTTRAKADFKRDGFSDRAASVTVDGGRWEVCVDGDFRGDCVLLRPGNYGSLRQMGLDNGLSSARRITDDSSASYGEYYSPVPAAVATYEYRRRPNERVYEARVASVRGVMDIPGRSCWIEQEPVDGSDVPELADGGVIGSVLHHQTGSTTAVEQRCETADRGPPDYWEVTYTFRGVIHQVRMSEPPGSSIYVNKLGEPRQ